MTKDEGQGRGGERVGNKTSVREGIGPRSGESLD